MKVHCTVEVLPFKQANWAPQDSNIDLIWAWRVISPTGNTLTGYCNGTKKQAAKKASAAASKMAEFARLDKWRYGKRI